MPHTTTVRKGESVTFRLDPVLKAELIRLAEQDDKSLGELLRELARERVAREQHRRFEVEARRQSAAIAERATTVLRLTSELHDAPLLRITLQPSSTNGLRLPSQICIGKAVTVPHSRISRRIGHVDPVTMQAVNQALARFLGLA